MAAGNRPLSPHLQVYRPQITSTLSILHRLTGVALAETVFVQSKTAKLRSGKTSLDSVVADLKFGEPLEVLGKEGNWLEVQTARGAKGWIFASKTTQTKPAGSEDDMLAKLGKSFRRTEAGDVTASAGARGLENEQCHSDADQQIEPSLGNGPIERVADEQRHREDERKRLVHYLDTWQDNRERLAMLPFARLLDQFPKQVRDLSREHQRAGQMTSARLALERAATFEPDGPDTARLQLLRRMAAPAAAPGFSFSSDSDGNTRTRVEAVGDFSVADAARVFHADEWRALALRNAEFLRATLVADGRAWRVHRGRVHTPGFLEDQAAIALGFLAVYELTSDAAWFAAAREMTEKAIGLFRDPASGAPATRRSIVVDESFDVPAACTP